MRNKKAQQSVGMSFGVIFSIILIIAFVSFAFIAIKFFLGFQKTAQITQFYNNLQSEVDKARGLSSIEKEYEINLPKGITHVCFMNTSKEKTSDQSLSSQILMYDAESNVFLIPQKETKGSSSKKINYINIEEITRLQNPYCVESSNALFIIKDSFSKNIIIR